MTFDTAGKLLSGVTLDRSTFRPFLQDGYRSTLDATLWRGWLVYAWGWVNPNDANTATLALKYEKNDKTVVTLGSTTQAGAGWIKKTMGPFSVLETAGVPQGESVPMVRLHAIKSAGVAGDLENWSIALRLLGSPRG